MPKHDEWIGNPDVKPLVGNTTDEKQIRNGRKKEKIDANEAISDTLGVLNLDAGRRFLFDLLDYCAVWHSCYSPEVTKMAYQTGQQDVGHWVMARIADANPGVIAKLHEENAQRHKEISKKP